MTAGQHLKMDVFMGITFLLAFTPYTCDGLAWSDDMPRKPNAEIQLCSGQNIQLPWSFVIHEQEIIDRIVWSADHEDNKGEKVLAVFAENNFMPMAEFSGRLHQLNNGGIEISCATVLEAGTYSVVVRVQDGGNSTTKYTRSAVVNIIDTPKTTSKELQLSQDPEPVYDEVSGQHQVQLSCGHFSDRGHPPVDVVWKTPDGESVVGSSSFVNGFFHLQLPNPPKGGNYSCGLSPFQPATTCLSRDSLLLGGAAKVQDAIQMRFLLLESKQAKLEKENVDLLGAVAELKRQTMEDRSLIDNRTYLLTIEDNPLQIGFHAMLRGEPKILASQHVKPWIVFTNEGQAFNPTTGEFITPLSGFYFFVASTGAVPSDGDANIQLMKEGVGRVSETWLRKYSTYWNMGSCHATLHLKAGEKVWLKTQQEGTLDQESTSFSGFLIHADSN